MYTPRIYYSIFSINSMKAITQSIVHNENRRTCGNPLASKVMQISSCFLCKWLAFPRFIVFLIHVLLLRLLRGILSLGEKGWRFTIHDKRNCHRFPDPSFVTRDLLNYCLHFYFKAKKYTTKPIISIFPAPSFQLQARKEERKKKRKNTTRVEFRQDLRYRLVCKSSSR